MHICTNTCSYNVGSCVYTSKTFDIYFWMLVLQQSGQMSGKTLMLCSMFHQVALVRRKCNGESCRVDRSCPLYLCLYCYDALHPPMPTGVEEIDAHRLHGACSSCVSLLVPFTVHRASRLIVFNLFFVLFSQRI